MTWIMSPECLVIQECLLQLRDEMVHLFLYFREMISDNKRVHSKDGLTKKILNRRLEDDKVTKYVIVKIREDDDYGRKLCNRILENKSPLFRHKREYLKKEKCCNLYPQELLPGNAAFYSTSFQYRKVTLKSPFEANLKRSFKRYVWKNNDADFKKYVHLSTKKYATTFFSKYLKRVFTQKSLENKTLYCFLKVFASPKRYEYYPGTLNANSALYNDYLEQKDLYLKDAKNKNELTIPSYDRLERFEQRITKGSSSDSIITAEMNFQNKEIVIEYKLKSTISEEKRIVLESIYDLTCEPFMQTFKSIGVKKEYEFLVNVVEKKSKPFEDETEEKDIASEIRSHSRSTTTDEDNSDDLSYEPFRMIEEIQENILLDNLVENKEGSLECVIEPDEIVYNTQKTFHEDTSDKHLLKNIFKCDIKTSEIKNYERKNIFNEIVKDKFIQNNAEKPTISQNNERGKKDWNLHGDNDSKKEFREAVINTNNPKKVSNLIDYKYEIGNNDIKDENQELRERINNRDKVVQDKPTNASVERDLKFINNVPKKNRRKYRNLNIGKEIKVGVPTEFMNVNHSKIFSPLHNFSYKVTTAIKTNDKKKYEDKNEKIIQSKLMQKNAEVEIISENQLHQKLEGKDHISNNKSEIKTHVPEDPVLEHDPKKDFFFYNFASPDNILMPYETSEITTKNPHEMYVNVNVSNKDLYFNPNNSLPKIDETQNNKKLEIHKTQRSIAASPSKVKSLETDTSVHDNVDKRDMVNNTSPDIQTFLEMSSHIGRCTNPDSYGSPKILKRRRIPKPVLCVGHKYIKNCCVIDPWLDRFTKKLIYKTQSLGVIEWEDNAPVEEVQKDVTKDISNLTVDSKKDLKESQKSLTEEYADKDTGKIKRSQSDEKIITMTVDRPTTKISMMKRISSDDQSETTTISIKETVVQNRPSNQQQLIEGIPETTNEFALVSYKDKKQKSITVSNKNVEGSRPAEQLKRKENENNPKLKKKKSSSEMLLVKMTSKENDKEKITEDIEISVMTELKVDYDDDSDKSFQKHKSTQTLTEVESEIGQKVIRKKPSSETLLVKMTSKENDNENEDVEISIMMESKVDYDEDINKNLLKNKTTETLTTREKESEQNLLKRKSSSETFSLTISSKRNEKGKSDIKSKVIMDSNDVNNKNILKNKPSQTLSVGENKNEQKLLTTKSSSQTLLVKINSKEANDDQENENIEISVMMESNVDYDDDSNKIIQKHKPSEKLTIRENQKEQNLIKRNSSVETFSLKMSLKGKESGKEDLKNKSMGGSKVGKAFDKNNVIGKNKPIEKAKNTEKEREQKLLARKSSNETFSANEMGKENVKNKSVVGSKGGKAFDRNKVIDKNKPIEKSTNTEKEREKKLLSRKSSSETFSVKMSLKGNEKEKEDVKKKTIVGSKGGKAFDRNKVIDKNKPIEKATNTEKEREKKLLARKSSNDTFSVKMSLKGNEKEKEDVKQKSVVGSKVGKAFDKNKEIDKNKSIEKATLTNKGKEEKLIRKTSSSETFSVTVSLRGNENGKEDIKTKVTIGSNVDQKYDKDKKILEKKSTEKSINKGKGREQNMLKKTSSSENVSVKMPLKENEKGKEKVKNKSVVDSKKGKAFDKNKLTEKSTNTEKEQNLLKKTSSSETFSVSVSLKGNEKGKEDVKTKVTMGSKVGQNYDKNKNVQRSKSIEKSTLTEKDKENMLLKKTSSTDTFSVKMSLKGNEKGKEDMKTGTRISQDYEKNKSIQKNKPNQAITSVKNNNEQNVIRKKSASETVLVKIKSKEFDNELGDEDVEITILMESNVDYDDDSFKSLQKPKPTEKITVKENEKEQNLIKRTSSNETFSLKMSLKGNEKNKEEVNKKVMRSNVGLDYGNNKNIQKNKHTEKATTTEKEKEQKLVKKQSSSETFFVSVSSKEYENENRKDDVEINVMMGSNVDHDYGNNPNSQKKKPLEKSTFKEKEKEQKLLKTESSSETIVVTVSSKEKGNQDVEINIIL